MLDDLDREAWFKLFVQVAHRYRWKVHVWCLLDNHFHLLVETAQPDLSAGMQRLNGVYAMRFNRRYNRAGHLFQGRFESRVIKTEEYLAKVMPYIYENSTRVGLRGWPWRGIGSIPADYACPRDDGRVDAEQASGFGHRAPRGCPGRS